MDKNYGNKRDKKDEKKDKDKENRKKNAEIIGDVDGRYSNETSVVGIPGINTPGVGMGLPAFNPPVPNRAWTAMRNGVDIDNLTEEEKRDLYWGKDPLI